MAVEEGDRDQQWPELDIGGTDLPDGFPDSVTLTHGEVLAANSVGGDKGKVRKVSVRVDDASVLVVVGESDGGFVANRTVR